MSVLQVALGVAQFAGLPYVATMNGGYLGEESAAWNVALGLAFAGVVRSGRCPSGVLMTVTAFVAMLTALTVGDVIDGSVGPVRIATHGLLAIGYTVTVLLSRSWGRDRGGPAATKQW